METIENKVFAVLRQLNTLIGYTLPKGGKVNDICKKAGLDVATCKKVIKVLSRDGYLEVTGKAAGTKHKILKKIDVDTTSVVNSILSYKEKVVKSPKKETSRGFVVAQTPKTYQIGQKVYTLCHNKITEGYITCMKITDDECLDKVTNNRIEYQLLIDGPNKGHVTCNIYQFSDTIDGLLTLLKYEYERSK